MLQIGPASLATIPLKLFYCCRYFSAHQRTELRNFGQKSFSQTAASCVAVQPFLRAFCEKNTNCIRQFFVLEYIQKLLYTAVKSVLLLPGTQERKFGILPICTYLIII